MKSLASAVAGSSAFIVAGILALNEQVYMAVFIALLGTLFGMALSVTAPTKEQDNG